MDGDVVNRSPAVGSPLEALTAALAIDPARNPDAVIP